MPLSSPEVNFDAAAVTMVWGYIGDVVQYEDAKKEMGKIPEVKPKRKNAM